MGFRDSGISRPRMNRIMSTGTSVIAKMEEKATANVFVHAKGRNMRPSCASNRKTGRKETTMITNEKKIAGPTCLAESNRIFRLRGSGRGSDSEDWCSESCRYPFSTMTMAAYTRTPIDRDKPPSDKMFEETR